MFNIYKKSSLFRGILIQMSVIMMNVTQISFVIEFQKLKQTTEISLQGSSENFHVLFNYFWAFKYWGLIL